MPAIEQLEKIAKDEPEIEKTIKKYSKIVNQARQIKEKQEQKQLISDSEKKIYEEYKNLRHAIYLFNFVSPANFILHFYRNGDLKWIWGITETDTQQTVERKSFAGRIADSQNVDLW